MLLRIRFDRLLLAASTLHVFIPSFRFRVGSLILAASRCSLTMDPAVSDTHCAYAFLVLFAFPCSIRLMTLWPNGRFSTWGPMHALEILPTLHNYDPNVNKSEHISFH